MLCVVLTKPPFSSYCPGSPSAQPSLCPGLAHRRLSVEIWELVGSFIWLPPNASLTLALLSGALEASLLPWHPGAQFSTPLKP